MKLYHGSKTSFARFDVDLAGTNTALADGLKFGLWLTDNPDYARQYGPTVLAVEVPENINLKRFSSWDELEREINEYDSPEEFVSALLKNGFQGVIFYQNGWAPGQDIGIFDLGIIELLEFSEI